MGAEAKLQELGITLPAPPAALAAYIPWVRSGNLVFTAGQVPVEAGEVKYKGKLGAEVSIEDGYQAARLCALNGLAQIRAAVGSLDKVSRVVKLVVFVASTPEFTRQPQVANGASELVGEIFGERGRHARSAVGAPSLPLNSAVEVEMIVEVES